MPHAAQASRKPACWIPVGVWHSCQPCTQTWSALCLSLPPSCQVFNEQNSPFYEANSAAAAAALAELSEDDAGEANKKYSINGFLYCNLPNLNMTVGDK